MKLFKGPRTTKIILSSLLVVLPLAAVLLIVGRFILHDHHPKSAQTITAQTIPGKKPDEDDGRRNPFDPKSGIKIDRYGQVAGANFPDKVTDDRQLQEDAALDRAYYESLKPPSDFDRLGGLSGSNSAMRLQATGFFNIQWADGKPRLVTPEGDVFFSLGVNGVTNNETYTKVTGSGERRKLFEWVPDNNGEYKGAFIGKDNFSFYMANKYRKTGTMPTFNQFFAEAADRIKKWGFNSIGVWTPAPQAEASGMPYTLMLPLNGMAKPKEIKVFDIFADGAAKAIDDAFRKTLPAHKDDPNLIGYFVDNEYRYDLFMSTVPKMKASTSGLKKRLVRMLLDEYGTLDAFNKGWNTKFTSFSGLYETPLPIRTQQAKNDLERYFRLYLDAFYRTVRAEFKKYDPNHLLLGDRWLLGPVQNPHIRGILSEEAGKYMDVISINYYSRTLDTAMLNDVYEKSGHRPILLSEWSYGTGVQGLAPIVLGAGATEQERGRRYRSYVEGAAALGFVVGAHWFDYVDQAAGGRFFQGLYGEHYNTGLVNVADRPYKTFLNEVMAANGAIYDVLLGRKEPFR